ncbi:hypothetical protein HYALB_00010339, partial [Hymenoscyphus albidus]
SAIVRERGISSSHNVHHSTPGRSGSERGPGISRNGTRRGEENRSPANLPKAFEGMLKTTTETGDIGMFSIKPSRVPPPINSPRRLGSYKENGPPKQQFHPYGVPAVDDRRRLPSYARDATSELISMYQSPSQKSSRRFDDNDYRSYSMTQTTSYTLSNHRSYASLRSQPEGPSMLQRPRSPFAYPTRLKRPGFRPSSPALTDGGGVDYRRRAEIDRTPYGPGHSTSSPSSLYAQKRRPPLTLRADGNRSTPSLLSQPSPPRRCSSPLVPQSASVNGDWARRHGPASVNTSPARSTFSLASTANLVASNLPPSNATTPGKAQSQSPMYYDYTEDFEVDEYQRPLTREPPPQFRMAETIPEDRPMHTERPSLVDPNTRNMTPTLKSGIRVSSSSASIHQAPANGLQDSMLSDSYWPAQKSNTSNGSESDISSREESNGAPQQNGSRRDPRELNKRLEEVFRANQLRRHGDNDLRNGALRETHEQRKEVDQVKAVRPKFSFDQPSRREPSPQTQDSSREDSLNDIQSPQDEISTPQKAQKLVISSLSPPKSTRKNSGYQQKRSSSLDFASPAGLKRVRSSGFNSVNDLTDLSELINSLDSANGSLQHDDTTNSTIIPPERVTMNSPTIPEEMMHPQPTSQGTISPPLSVFNKPHNQGAQTTDSQMKKHHRRQRPPRIDVSALHGANELVPRNSVSRSGSPMHAPKPISPARQLKLKNSVPQLMKALPPLPPHLRMCEITTPETVTEAVDTPSFFSSAKSGGNSTFAGNIQSPPKVFQRARTQTTEHSDTLVGSSDTREVSLSVKIPENLATQGGKLDLQPIASPPKLKLKMRSSASTLQSPSHNSRPWNSEENYPWSNQDPSIRLPSIVSKETSKPPKFRLKSNRLSNSNQDLETQDTVRVNPEARDSRISAGLHLPNPKDLFTPNIGIDNIFRQVSRHIHSRKSSSNSSHPGREGSPGQVTSLSIGNRNTAQTSPLVDSQEDSAELNTSNSDGQPSSQGRHSLRKRFSNLRSRITGPYLSRSASRSYDDMTSKNMNRLSEAIPMASRSVPNLRGSIGLSVQVEDTTLQPSGERTRRVKLREKISRWLKGARMAFTARVRSLAKVEESRA